MAKRIFGADKPTFMAFAVEGVDGEFQLPLAASLPSRYSVRFAEIAAEKDEAQQELTAQRFIMELLGDYCPGLTDNITISTAGDILAAWMEDSGKQGATPGE